MAKSNPSLFFWVLVYFSLALLELRYLLGGLLFNFKIEVPDETNADSMSEVEFGVPRPKSGKMALRFIAWH